MDKYGKNKTKNLLSKSAEYYDKVTALTLRLVCVCVCVRVYQLFPQIEEAMVQPLRESRDRYEELKQIDDAMNEVSLCVPMCIICAPC